MSKKLTSIAVAGVLLWGLAGTASATPMLQITANAANPATPDSPNQTSWTNVGAAQTAASPNAESIGDQGGTSYPFPGSNVSTSPGAGLPTDQGGWPNNYPTPGTYPPGFALDTGLPPGAGNYGISGWDASYLNLTESGYVTFQYMGKGDATDRNLFQVWDSSVGGWKTVFDTFDTHGTCAVGAGPSSGPTNVVCDPFPGSSYTQYFDAGLLAFQFVNLTTPGVAINDGSNNISPDDPPYPSHGGFFLGVDPYLATTAYQNSGQAVYAGFTDRGFTAEGIGDHDYEDLIVRVTVPEPGSIFLMGIGLVGMAVVIKRRKTGKQQMAA